MAGPLLMMRIGKVRCHCSQHAMNPPNKCTTHAFEEEDRQHTCQKKIVDNDEERGPRPHGMRATRVPQQGEERLEK